MRAIALILLTSIVIGALAEIAYTPNGHGVAQSRPAIEGRAEGKAEDSKSPTDHTAPVARMIQTPNDTARRANREAESDDHEKAELEAQIRQAVAAESQATASRWNVWLTVFGTIVAVAAFFGLWRTYEETKRTANASVDAAKASDESAKAATKSATVAERALLDLDTPFVYPIIKSCSYRTDRSEIRITGFASPQIIFTVKNFGRTPALMQYVACRFDKLDSITAKIPKGIWEDVAVDTIIAAEQESSDFIRETYTEIDKTAMENIERDVTHLWVCGEVGFLDIFGNEHTQSFAFLYLRGADRFVARGPEYNRRKRKEKST